MILNPEDYLPGQTLIAAKESALVANVYGRVFRNIPDKLDLAQAATYWYKFNCLNKLKVLDRVITILQGSISYEVIVSTPEAPVVETDPGVQVLFYSSNNTFPRAQLFTMFGNVLASGGLVIDYVELATGQGSGRVSIPDAQIGGRILAKDTSFYLKFTGLSAVANRALLNLLILQYDELAE